MQQSPLRLPRPLPYHGGSSAFRTRLQIGALETRRGCGQRLHWIAEALCEGRPQHLVAPADAGDARFQAIDIERPRQTRHFDNLVVIARRIETAEEVDPLLLWNDKGISLPSAGALPSCDAAASRSLSRCCKASGEPYDRRRIEDIAKRKVDAKAFPQPVKYLRHREGVAPSANTS